MKTIPNTKTMTTSKLYLPITAMMLMAALALPMAAEQPLVPFQGTMQGTDEDTAFTATTVTVATTGSGIATQLGQFKFTQEVIVTFATGTSAGSAHFTAANGDTIDTTIAGSGKLADTPGLFSIVDVHTITGGTGRFAGAKGTFIVERLASAVTFLTSGSFHGAISSPGAAH